MAKPCAVFWDIENIDVPKGQSVDTIVNLIRSTIIEPFNLNETFFYCVCDVNKLALNLGQSLTNVNVHIVQAYNGVKDSADMKILDLMRQFIKLAGQDCTIILISGDGDYYGTLNDLKKLYNVSIHLIGLANSFSSKLDEISDYTFILNNGTLTPVKSTGSPMYFISISNYPLTMEMRQVMSELNAQAIGSIQNSAILYNNLICIGFPILWNAERAIGQFNTLRFHGRFVKTQLIAESRLTEILKCLKHNVTLQPRNHQETKKLNFIQMNSSDEALKASKVIKFCIACNVQSGIQCILSRKTLFWIVFNFKSDAEDCLSKLQIMYPDAIISEPPTDLTFTYFKNQYKVESCQHKFMDKVNPDFEMNNSHLAVAKQGKQVNEQCSNYQTNKVRYSYINPITDNTSQVTKESVTLQKSINPDLRDAVSSNIHDDNDLKIFFQFDHIFVANMLPDYLTKWTLLYNLFEKLYDLGAKKVILFDVNLYCAHFDSVAAYQNAFAKVHSRDLSPFEFTNPLEAHRTEITNQMDRYITGIPWCLNCELDLCCLVLKIEAKFHEHFIQVSKMRLIECIFIKSFSGEIWIGFPDERICRVNEKTVIKNYLKYEDEHLQSCSSIAIKLKEKLNNLNDVSMARPSYGLLESINLRDLAGDAYDLAFLSHQLESLKPIARPRIIERISRRQIQTKEGHESLFYLSVMHNMISQPRIAFETSQATKVIVNLSKVIPIAVNYTEHEINFIYNSEYEANAACKFIGYNGNLIFNEIMGFCCERSYQSLKRDEIMNLRYFIIKDHHKVLEKIVQNQSLVDKLNSNTVEPASAIDVMCIRKIAYIFTITTDSEFKFTSGMISIIKMYLIQMHCPVCVEFEDKIWVGIEDLENGNQVKVMIERITFKMLHENDEDDFEVGVVMNLTPSIPLNVFNMLAKKVMNLKETPSKQSYFNVTNDSFHLLDGTIVPLGHFNYNLRKAAGMSINQYCQLIEDTESEIV